jgi:hypothetical protein
MTLSQRRQAPTAWSLPLVAVSAVVSVLALVACTGAVAQVHLPAPASRSAIPRQSAAATASGRGGVSTPLRLTQREQVVAAFSAFVTALRAAEMSKNASDARLMLRKYLVPKRIDGLVQAIAAIWAKGESFYGKEIVRVSSVTIRGGRAFVRSCDDTSAMGLATTVTGQAVPGSVGAPQTNLVTCLDLLDGRWLVAFELIEDVPCAP